MSEREYRRALAAVLAEIEAEARRLGRKVLLPAALGAGLALGAGGCGDDTTTGPTADAWVGRPDAVYGTDAGPWPDLKRDTASDADLMVGRPDAVYAADSGPWSDLARDASSEAGADAASDTRAAATDATSDAVDTD